MSRHHCGAENADTAKFCRGCGENLAPAFVAPAAAVAAAETKLMAELEQQSAIPATPPQAQTISPQTAHAAPVASVTASASVESLAGAVPSATASNRRTKALILVAAVSLAALTGTAWWKFGKDKGGVDKDATVSQSASATSTASAADNAASQTVVRVSTTASGKSSATSAAATGASSTNKQAGMQREEKARRKTEQETQRADAGATRKRDAEEHARVEEVQRRPAQAESHSVQQICADSANATTRSFCETKECARPNQFNTPYCVAFRKRYEQSNNVQF